MLLDANDRHKDLGNLIDTSCSFHFEDYNNDEMHKKWLWIWIVDLDQQICHNDNDQVVHKYIYPPILAQWAQPNELYISGYYLKFLKCVLTKLHAKVWMYPFFFPFTLNKRNWIRKTYCNWRWLTLCGIKSINFRIDKNFMVTNL